MRKNSVIVIVILGMFLAAVLGFVFGRSNTSPLIDPEGSALEGIGPIGAPVPIGNEMMNYTSKFGFSFEYPSELGQVSDRDEGGGAHTVVFESASGEKGFQIYVQPYQGTTISQSKFREDNPSGVMNEPLEVLIGGVRATIFYGNVEGFGETREVWFIHNGYLYEIVTYKELDTWLAEILKTWKFQ